MSDIITDGVAVEAAEDDETLSVEESFERLGVDTKEVTQRLNTIADELERRPGTVTYKDLAKLYRFLSGDLLSLLKDSFELSEALALGDDDDDEDDEEEDGVIDEDTLTIYITLSTSQEAFKNLAGLKGVSPEQKTGMLKLSEMNLTAMAILEEQLGEGLQVQAEARIKEGISDGAIDSDGE